MSRDRELLILHAGQEELRICSARLADGSVRLSRAASFLCPTKQPDGSPLQDQTTLDALHEHLAQQKSAGCDLICIVSGSTVACQHLDMPPLAGRALEQAVRLKLAPQLHFDIGQSIVAVTSEESEESGENKKIRVQAAALRSDIARAVVDTAQRAGLDLVALSAAPAALAAIARHRRNDHPGLHAVLHVDEKSSTLIVQDESRTIVTSELPLGAAELTAAYMRPIIHGENVVQLDEPAALNLRNEVGVPSADQAIERLGLTGDRLLPLLEPALQKFAKQLTQWLAFATTCNSGVRVPRMHLVGPGSRIPGFASALAARLSIDVQARDWLAGWVALDDAASPGQVESYAALAGAAAFGRGLPSLIPPEYRRQRRLRRIRQSVTWCGPIAACAVFLVGLLFGRLESSLSGSPARNDPHLGAVEQVLDRAGKWNAVSAQIRELEGQLTAFSEASPSWIGVFKELSLTLPSELRALEYTARYEEDGMSLVIRAAVHPDRARRGFDEIVAQTLLLLQRSSFFRRVELVSANQGNVPEDPRAVGAISVELDLVYPQPRSEERGA